nr:ThiF family adenylyltransferase [Corynebacterium phocae]
MTRYARQEALFGPAAQARLSRATVSVIGAGGLGSPALLYLAGAGVGTVRIFDDDVVSRSNLHRQIIHADAAVGTPKAASAQHAIAALNPSVAVEKRGRLTPDTALAQLAGTDVLVDGSDNLHSRYLCSWAAHRLHIPHVWASILGFDAQLSVFYSGHGPVYEDVFPDMPAPGAVPSCSQAGVLGPVVGTVGSAMALETLKLLTGVGTPLIGQLGYLDGLTGKWEYVPLRAGGAVPTQPAAPPEVRTIPAGARVIDVRTATERAEGFIPGSQHFPLADIQAGQSPALAPHEPAVIYCATGVRSAKAVDLLRARGFTDVVSLRGGFSAWEEDNHSPS